MQVLRILKWRKHIKKLLLRWNERDNSAKTAIIIILFVGLMHAVWTISIQMLVQLILHATPISFCKIFTELFFLFLAIFVSGNVWKSEKSGIITQHSSKQKMKISIKKTFFSLNLSSLLMDYYYFAYGWGTSYIWKS